MKIFILLFFSQTSSVISGVGIEDTSVQQAPLTTHLKLIELSEALAVHNASAAYAASLQSQIPTEPVASVPPTFSDPNQQQSPEIRERRKSTGGPRFLITGPLPPPPPPPQPQHA